MPLHLVSSSSEVLREVQLLRGALNITPHTSPSHALDAIADEFVSALEKEARTITELETVDTVVFIGRTATDRFLRPRHGAPSRLLRTICRQKQTIEPNGTDSKKSDSDNHHQEECNGGICVTSLRLSISSFDDADLMVGRSLAPFLRDSSAGSFLCKHFDFISLGDLSELDTVLDNLVMSSSFNDHVDGLSIRVTLVVGANDGKERRTLELWFVNDRHLNALQHTTLLHHDSVRSVAIVSSCTIETERYFDAVRFLRLVVSPVDALQGLMMTPPECKDAIEFAGAGTQLLLDVLAPFGVWRTT